MKKLIVFAVIFTLIVSTSLIKNSTKDLDDQIYSLRENQLSALISNLNIYLKDFDLPFKIDTKLIDKFYTNNLKSEDYEEKLKNNRKIDTLFGGCAIGPHKSDYIFCVNDKRHSVKDFWRNIAYKSIKHLFSSHDVPLKNQ